MIRRALPEEEAEFFLRAKNHPLAALRMRAAWDCYKNHPQLCGFYLADKACLLLTGQTALVAGPVTDAEELAVFFRFSGVRQAENAPPLPGFAPAEHLLMARAPAPAPLPEKVTLTPDLWRLHEAELFEDPDGWYADACLRRRQGAAIAALESGGRYAACAGLYAQSDTDAWLSAVTTHPDFRGRGYASACVSALLAGCEKKVWLLCRPQLKALYRPLGFEKVPTDPYYLQEERI